MVQSVSGGELIRSVSASRRAWQWQCDFLSPAFPPEQPSSNTCWRNSDSSRSNTAERGVAGCRQEDSVVLGAMQLCTLVFNLRLPHITASQAQRYVRRVPLQTCARSCSGLHFSSSHSCASFIICRLVSDMCLSCLSKRRTLATCIRHRQSTLSPLTSLRELELSGSQQAASGQSQHRHTGQSRNPLGRCLTLGFLETPQHDIVWHLESLETDAHWMATC